jgi:hypothetical protein
MVLIAAVHLPSKLRYSTSTQRRVASDLAEEILRREQRGHEKPSLIIGDVNMNPFDPGMIEADALNAVCSREVAALGSRVVNGKSYPMFFNPMWGHMGDYFAKPSGTFYRRTQDNDCIFFHTLDQVLLRPSLLAFNPTVEIITGDGIDSFTTPRDIPRKRLFSDHLPVLLTINF